MMVMQDETTRFDEEVLDESKRSKDEDDSSKSSTFHDVDDGQDERTRFDKEVLDEGDRSEDEDDSNKSSTFHEDIDDGKSDTSLGSFLRSVPIDKATTGACIGEGVGDSVGKEFRIQRKATFCIRKEQWTKMCKTVRTRYFKKGQWHEPFIKGIKQSNPYCVLMIRRHHVSTAKQRFHRGKSILNADLYCKFEDSPITAKLTMDGKFNARVTYSHDVVMHHLGEQRARPIRGTEREHLKGIFSHGQKPFNEYLRRLGKKDPAHVVLAGNFDLIGTTKQVLHQVSHEAGTSRILDKDELTSLHLLKSKMETQTKNKKVKGFIQLIAASPSFVFYWSEEGVRLWHDLCKKDVALIDATGNVVRSAGKKRYLYYEVCIWNTVEGESPIPIMGMLSTVHTATVIRFWIAEFRRCEKLLFWASRGFYSSSNEYG